MNYTKIKVLLLLALVAGVVCKNPNEVLDAAQASCARFRKARRPQVEVFVNSVLSLKCGYIRQLQLNLLRSSYGDQEDLWDTSRKYLESTLELTKMGKDSTSNDDLKRNLDRLDELVVELRELLAKRSIPY